MPSGTTLRGDPQKLSTKTRVVFFAENLNLKKKLYNKVNKENSIVNRSGKIRRLGHISVHIFSVPGLKRILSSIVKTHLSNKKIDTF